MEMVMQVDLVVEEELLVTVVVQCLAVLELNLNKIQINHIHPIMEIVEDQVVMLVAAVVVQVAAEAAAAIQLVLVDQHNHFLHLLDHFFQVCLLIGEIV
tara:strand:- start:147 stop:443 length:297 start_codon:yes stop_codon:yes gene_type:complete